MSREAKRVIRTAGWVLFLIYLTLLIYLLFFSESYGRQDFAARQYRYNLQPFQEIRRFAVYWKNVGFLAAFLNLGGNVLGFMPFGFLMPVLSARMRRAVTVVLLGFSVSLAVETIQLVTRVGIFDVDDLMLNTLGAALGYLVFAVCNRVRRKIYYGKKI